MSAELDAIDAELVRLTAMRLAAEDACSISEEFIEDAIDRALATRWALQQQIAGGWAAT